VSHFSGRAEYASDGPLRDCFQIVEIVLTHVDLQELVCGTVESHPGLHHAHGRLPVEEEPEPDPDRIAGTSHVHVHGTGLDLGGPVAAQRGHVQVGDAHVLVANSKPSNQTYYHTGNPFDKRVP